MKEWLSRPLERIWRDEDGHRSIISRADNTKVATTTVTAAAMVVGRFHVDVLAAVAWACHSSVVVVMVVKTVVLVVAWSGCSSSRCRSTPKIIFLFLNFCLTYWFIHTHTHILTHTTSPPHAHTTRLVRSTTFSSISQDLSARMSFYFVSWLSVRSLKPGEDP